MLSKVHDCKMLLFTYIGKFTKVQLFAISTKLTYLNFLFGSQHKIIIFETHQSKIISNALIIGLHLYIATNCTLNSCAIDNNGVWTLIRNSVIPKPKRMHNLQQLITSPLLLHKQIIASETFGLESNDKFRNIALINMLHRNMVINKMQLAGRSAWAFIPRHWCISELVIR